MSTLSALWRYPIKSHGREQLDRVRLTAGKTMPGDRVWAVAHDAANADGSEWAPCANFSRGAKAPQLMAITAVWDEGKQTITLSHPTAGTLIFDPDGDTTEFLAWVKPLMPENRAQSARVLRAPDRGMTDTPFPSISLIGNASLAELSTSMDQDLDPARFRANIWIDGLAPFEEFELVGKTVQIGSVTFEVAERITRCLATTANPKTGKRDADTLAALETNWGHKDLGVYLRVLNDGDIAVGDSLSVL